MNSSNAFYDSLEKFIFQVLHFINFTDFKNFLQFSKEKSFLDAIGKWPIFEKTFKKWDSQSSILGEEEHRASQKLFVELRASLNLVEWDDDILEEDNMLISEWDCKTTDD